MKCLIITTLCVLFASTTVSANPTKVIYNDFPFQDPLFVPEDVHELGTLPGFTAADHADEMIDAFFTPQEWTVCFDTSGPQNDPLIPDVIIRMTNLTTIDWAEVWYVADEETTHSNYDGFVGEAVAGVMGTAFRIDTVGIHRPLIAESGILPGIFEAGESWEFVIQDYMNAVGLLPDALGSIGVPSLSPGAIDASSGSIIAVPVPEPATMALLSLGGFLLRRKSKA